MTDIQTPAGSESRGGTHPSSPTGLRRPMAGGALPRWGALVLDGRHEWGSLDTSPARHGVTRYRLVLFPPGIDTVERRLLRAWRAWPAWGAVLWAVSQFIASALLTAGTALVVSTFAYLSSGAILFACTAELRSRVRTLTVVRIAGFTDQRTAASFAELKSLAATLCRADAERAKGDSSPADHEAVWWQVYDRLDPNHPGPATC